MEMVLKPITTIPILGSNENQIKYGKYRWPNGDTKNYFKTFT